MSAPPTTLAQLLCRSCDRKAPNGSTIVGNGKTRLENFKAWLIKNGCQLHAPDKWEVCNFSFGGHLHTCVMFNPNGSLFWPFFAQEAWKDFTAGRAYRYFQNNPRINSQTKKGIVPDLLNRDGANCVICGQPLPIDDMSVEHLLDRVFGGTDHLANLALAHRQCNSEVAGVGSLREKIEFILNKRSLVCTS